MSHQGFIGVPRMDLLEDGRTNILVGSKFDGCVLREFVYVDADGFPHAARAGLASDGGSIPRLAWRLCPPWTGLGRWAYLIHDQESRDARSASSPWKAFKRADALFHEMLTFLGEPAWKAALMYLAVRLAHQRT